MKEYTLKGEVVCKNHVDVRLYDDDGDYHYLGCVGKYSRCGWQDGDFNKGVDAIAFLLGMETDEMLDAIYAGKEFKLKVERS